MLICLYEDRSQLPGLKLLILSLRRYCPSWPIRLRFPGMSDRFDYARIIPNVTAIDQELCISGSYNIKPTVLLDGLSVSDECIWIDTDVLANGQMTFLQRIPPKF